MTEHHPEQPATSPKKNWLKPELTVLDAELTGTGVPGIGPEVTTTKPSAGS